MRPHRLALVLSLFASPACARADSFDDYSAPLLAKTSRSEGTQEVRQLAPLTAAEHNNVLKDCVGALLIIRTNDERWAKLLVQAGRQRINAEKSLPVMLVERFVTFREGTEKTIQASGRNVSLFPGYRISLDLGQIVPDELAADLRLVVDGEKVYLEPIKDAKLFLVTKPLADATPPKSDKLVIREPIEPRFFNGRYKLHDDGRRSGTLTLKVTDDGEVTGTFVSEKDGQNYDVKGKIGPQKHAITFTIQFPRTEEVFQGWLFTGDGNALAGSSRLLERETGFYAVRVEDR